MSLPRELTNQRPFILFLHQQRHQILQLEHSVDDIIAGPHIDRLLIPLLLPHHQDIVVLGQLRLPDLLLHFAVGHIGIREHAIGPEHAPDFLGVLGTCFADGDDHDLAGIEPEGPLGCVVFGQNGQHPLHTSEDGAVNDDGAFLSTRLGDVGEVESDGQLEIELHGGALELAAQGVVDSDVDFGPVEGAIPGIERPGPSGALEGVFQGRFGPVPELEFAQIAFGAGGQGHGVFETEDVVHLAEQLEEAGDLLHDLVGAAEDVGVVLLEATDASESLESAAELVAVEDAKVGETKGEFAVGADAVAEHEAMARAVHGLEPKLLLLDIKAEHVFAVVVGVAGDLPEVEVEDVGRDDFLVLVVPVLLADELDEAVVDTGSVGEEEAAAGGEMVEEKELMLDTQVAVVALLGFLDAVLVLFQELGLGEGDAVHTLQALAFDIAAPEGATHGRDGEGLEVAGAGQMGTTAEIDHRADTVNGDDGIGGKAVDDLELELVLLEHGKGLIATHDYALELLIFFDGRVDTLLNATLVALRKILIAKIAIVIEALLKRRTNGKVDTEF
mmetsp:Transcript_5067/g.9371  ORF Transcript_5067/g.9371 Transcript_5067/m.9371 type:complete len:558 (-) Transcript_5067:471-2144(-)